MSGGVPGRVRREAFRRAAYRCQRCLTADPTDASHRIAGRVLALIDTDVDLGDLEERRQWVAAMQTAADDAAAYVRPAAIMDAGE